jgi:putative ABC transport system permease protein
MRRLAVRSLLAHKLRLALSGLAVVLGVAFVAGTLVFTDTLSRTFTEVVESTAADVNVTASRSFETQGPGMASSVLLPETLADDVRSLDGVASVAGYVQSEGVYVIGTDGKVVATGGAPGVGVGWDTQESLGMTLAEGRVPVAADEILLDESTAATTGYEIGDHVDVLTPGPRVEATVVGILCFGESGGLAGASLVAFEQSAAQDLLAEPGTVHGLSIQAAEGVADAQLATRVEQALGAGFDVTTRAEEIASQTEAMESQLSFVSTFLLVFAGIALFVGSFIILNTFAMLVAQRTKQLALLRALGAGRRQVTNLVMAEALVLGVLGSTLGLLSGLGIASGLRALFGQMGLTLDGGLVIEPSTIVASYVVGVLVTLVAAYRPARRAAKVAPVAALRDDQAMPERSLRVRAVGGSVLAAAGGVSLVTGALDVAEDGAAVLVGAGSLALLVAAILLSPVLAGPFVRAVGAMLPRLAGPAGRLARDNALRNPRRTAATASALMVGATLVSAFSIIGASANASIGTTVDETLHADFIVSTSVGQPFSPAIAEEMRDIDGVSSVGVSRLGSAQLDGEVATFMAADEVTMEKGLVLDVVDGRATGGLLADTATADVRGWQVGDVVRAVGVDGTELAIEVAGTFEPNAAVGPLVVPLDDVDALGGEALDRWLFLEVADGADAGAVRASAETVLTDYPVVTVKDHAEFTQEQQAQVGQILLLINAMLVLSVLIAVLGIVNTLALSVMERTREVGLLRAVGMSRRQLRRAVRLEAVLIALFGAVLGLGLGATFGTSLVSVMDGQGFEELAVPGTRLAGLVVLAAVVGVLAAVWPARRASRMPVLEAIATA